MYRNLPALEDLEALLSVAHAGSISTAAREKMVHQQTMSARIIRAEKALGVTVFTRSPYGVVLTEQGAAILAALPDLFAAYHTFSSVVAAARHQDAPRHLTVAVSHSVAELYYPKWAAALYGSHPLLRLTMLQANSREVRDLVLSDAASVGVVEGGMGRQGLIEKLICSDELVLAVPGAHPWAARTVANAVTAQELRTTALLVREPGSGSRTVIEDVLGQLAEPAGEFGSLSAQRAGILALGTPAIISRGAVADQVALGRVVIVPTAPDVRFDRPISAVTRRGTTPSADATAFIDAARACQASVP